MTLLGHVLLHFSFFEKSPAGVQPRLIQGVRSGDRDGEDQDTIASVGKFSGEKRLSSLVYSGDQ